MTEKEWNGPVRQRPPVWRVLELSVFASGPALPLGACFPVGPLPDGAYTVCRRIGAEEWYPVEARLTLKVWPTLPVLLDSEWYDREHELWLDPAADWPTWARSLRPGEALNTVGAMTPAEAVMREANDGGDAETRFLGALRRYLG